MLITDTGTIAFHPKKLSGKKAIIIFFSILHAIFGKKKKKIKKYQG